MKRTTLEKHIQIANDIMYYIYTHIEINIDVNELSKELKVSKFHMHRIFKDIFGKNIYENIKSIRLQKASNLLLTNQLSTISDIAKLCGYSSQTSFIRVFKTRFNMSPKEWRNGGYKNYSKQILKQSLRSPQISSTFNMIEPIIVKMPDLHSYYIRHHGYDDSIKQTWQKLQTWTLSNNISDFQQIALFHDNPTITPLSECHYVACIALESKEFYSNSRLPHFKISKGIYAKFDLKGYYGDLIQLIHWVYHDWLPESDYETTTKPSYSIYNTNPYLNSNRALDVSFYLSIQY